MPTPVAPEQQERFRTERAAFESANQVARNEAEWRTQDEARNQPMMTVNAFAKYVFRSKPGTLRQGFQVRIPTLPDDYASDRERDRRERDFARRRKAVDGDKPAYDLASLREKVGGDTISFKPVPGNEHRQTTCFYATDDDEIAAFLLSAKKWDTSGVWDNIVVEYPTRMIEINGMKVPATNAGFDAARAAFLAEPIPAKDTNR